jgi:hypothetical protein
MLFVVSVLCRVSSLSLFEDLCAFRGNPQSHRRCGIAKLESSARIMIGIDSVVALPIRLRRVVQSCVVCDSRSRAEVSTIVGKWFSSAG